MVNKQADGFDSYEGDRGIAIIGMAARLPGAANIRQFWDNLVNGRESLSTFTDEQLRAAGVEEEKIRNPAYVRLRGILGDAACFDAGFFGFTPRDAEILDPQQRVFLECAWHALEDAGYDPAKTQSRIGVFGGVGTNWNLVDLWNNKELHKVASGTSIVVANDKDYLTTRVSYKLGLTGPSVNVQCACSTSVVAMVLGVQSLLSFETDMVLAGGATVNVPETVGYLYHEGDMESPDGHVRAFDAAARGTVFSRGAGIVLLKRLGDAVRDGDHIYAVIRGGAINNDGSAKVGFTAPSIKGQAEVAIEALELAGLTADQIGYVEAHGTGTQLGDPIEIASLSKAFGRYTERRVCPVAAEANIGHTDVASGAASVIKAALALENEFLPASLNFKGRTRRSTSRQVRFSSWATASPFRAARSPGACW